MSIEKSSFNPRSCMRSDTVNGERWTVNSERWTVNSERWTVNSERRVSIHAPVRGATKIGV